MNNPQPLYILLLCLFIAGCSSTSESTISNTESTKGIVVAEVLNNSRYIPNDVIGWSNIIVERVNSLEPNENSPDLIDSLESSKKTTAKLIRTQKRGLLQKLTYLGVLDPGMWRISALYHKNPGRGANENVVGVPEYLGTFTVEPGKVTDLGTIIYHPLFTPHFLQSNHSQHHLVARQTSPDLIRTIAQQLPKWQNKLSSPNSPSWLDDNFAQQREQSLKAIEDAAFPSNVFATDDELFITTKLGGLYQFSFEKNAPNKDRRSSKEKQAWWLPHQLHISGKINNIIKTVDNGYLLQIGASQLLLFDSSFSQRRLIKAFKSPSNSPNNPQADKTQADTIQAMIKHGQNVYVITIENSQNLVIYEFNGEALTQVSTTDISTLPGDVRFNSVSAFSVKDRINIRIGENLLQFNPDSYSLETQELASQRYIFNETDSYVTGALPSTLKGLGLTQISTDSGMTWLQTTVYENHIYMDSDKKLYHIHSGFTLDPENGAKVLEQVPFYASSDLGLTWQVVGELPRQCSQFQSQISTVQRLLVLCDNGNLMQSEDKGKSWTVIFARHQPTIN